MGLRQIAITLSMVDEPITEVLEKLPGCNVAQSSPNEAVLRYKFGQNGTVTVPVSSSTASTISSRHLSRRRRQTENISLISDIDLLRICDTQ